MQPIKKTQSLANKAIFCPDDTIYLKKQKLYIKVLHKVSRHFQSKTNSDFWGLPIESFRYIMVANPDELSKNRDAGRAKIGHARKIGDVRSLLARSKKKEGK